MTKKNLLNGEHQRLTKQLRDDINFVFSLSFLVTLSVSFRQLCLLLHYLHFINIIAVLDSAYCARPIKTIVFAAMTVL